MGFHILSNLKIRIANQYQGSMITPDIWPWTHLYAIELMDKSHQLQHLSKLSNWTRILLAAPTLATCKFLFIYTHRHLFIYTKKWQRISQPSILPIVTIIYSHWKLSFIQWLINIIECKWKMIIRISVIEFCMDFPLWFCCYEDLLEVKHSQEDNKYCVGWIFMFYSLIIFYFLSTNSL